MAQLLALEFLAASAAQDNRRISTAVEQHHHLLFTLQTQLDFFDKFARNHLFLAGFLELLPHVYHFDFR